MGMRVERRGTGPKLLLLPGLGCDSRLWGPVAADLERSFSLLLPHVWTAPSFPEAASELSRVLEEVRAPIGAAGLSMGGYLLFELLKLCPERVRAAAFLDTTAFPDPPERREARVRTLQLLGGGRFEEVLASFAASVLAPGYPEDGPARRTLLTMARDLGPRVFRVQSEQILRRGAYVEVLRLLRVPALFLAGELDALTPPSTTARMAAEVPCAQLHFVPGAGHLTPLEAPERVAALLGSFFGRVLA